MQTDRLSLVDSSGEVSDEYPHLVETEKQSTCLFYCLVENIIIQNFEAISQLLKINKANEIHRCMGSVSMSLLHTFKNLF